MSARRRFARSSAHKERRATDESYAADYDKLALAFRDWLVENPSTEVVFSFREGAAYFGPLDVLPEDCIASDGARSLWQFCVARCPEATCLMFQLLVERVTAAAIEVGMGTISRSPTGDT